VVAGAALGAGEAARDAVCKQVVVDLQLDHHINALAGPGEHGIERHGLGNGAREAIEDEAGLRLALLDPVLEHYLTVPLGTAAEHDALGTLIDRVTPVIEGVIRGKVGATLAAIEREELFSETILQLIKRLQEIKPDPARQTISNLNAYAAVTAFNVLHAHFRRTNPERQRLRNRIRHVVRKSTRFALWQSQGGHFVCGLGSWADSVSAECSEADLDRIPPLAPPLPASWNDDIGRAQIIRALDQVFDHGRKPVELERLVEKVAELLQLPVSPAQAARSERIDETASAESSLLYRSALGEVWREVDLLPPRQRIALLLSLRDENGSAITSEIILLRIATFDQLAAAVELSPEDLAAVWDQLPLPDTAIAERLDLSRQQVINLRKSARDRLGRRLSFLRDGNPLLQRASS
jgi:RNA polymerase sigma factor (sigma-70 family)